MANRLTVHCKCCNGTQRDVNFTSELPYRFESPCLAHIVWPKSKVSAYLSNCLPTPPSLLRLCRRNPSIVFHAVWGVALWLDLSAPPSPAAAMSNPCHAKNSPEKYLHLGADTRRWLARWKHSASGLPYQWRQCFVTQRERTSCSTTLLLFLLQAAAIALSFFFPSSSPVLFCRCEKEVWGWPVVHTFRQLCPPLNAPWIIPHFHSCCLLFSRFLLVTEIDTCSVAIMDLVTRILCLWG